MNCHAEILPDQSSGCFAGRTSEPCFDFAAGASFDENIVISPALTFEIAVFGGVCSVSQHSGLGC